MFRYIQFKRKLFLVLPLRSWLIGISLLISACSAATSEVGPLPESPLLRVLERKSGLIAYLGLDGNIYTIDQGGGQQTAITDDAMISEEEDGPLHFYQLPTWSPDSARLAFVALDGTRAGRTSASLLVSNLEGNERTEIFQSAEELPFYLYWAPDNERIGFLTSSSSTQNMILRTALVGGGESEILDAGRPYYWAWSPDGQSMVIHANGATATNPSARLASLSVVGGPSEQRLALDPHQFGAPAWSPEGNQLLLAGENQLGEGTLYLTDLRGSPFRELVNYETNIVFDWSPDGKQVAYIPTGGGIPGTLGPLSVITPDDLAETLTSPEEQVVAFFWSPNNKMIAYVVPVVQAAEGEETEGNPIQQAENLLLQMNVLEIQSGETRTVGVFQPSDPFMAMIPFFDQYQRSATIWSPDSQNLVLSALSSEGQPGIWVVPSSGNLPPRFITPGLMGFWSWK